MLQPVADDPYPFNETIEVLRSLSLIQRNTRAKTLSLHRLVQMVLKDEMDEGTQQVWRERCIYLLDLAFPSGSMIVEQWGWCEQLVPHVRTSFVLSTLWDILLPEAASLFHKAATYLLNRARYDEVEPLLQRALQIREQQLGPDHPDVALTLNNLAILYKNQALYAQAEPLYQRALHISEQTLGANHPEVAHYLLDLAILYNMQGRYAQAAPLYQRASTIREAHFGSQHHETAEILHDLAIFHHDQAHIAEAENLYQRALAIREPLLGLQHPDTQATATRYAALLHTTGLADEAAVLEARLMESQNTGTSTEDE